MIQVLTGTHTGRYGILCNNKREILVYCGFDVVLIPANTVDWVVVETKIIDE